MPEWVGNVCEFPRGRGLGDIRPCHAFASLPVRWHLPVRISLATGGPQHISLVSGHLNVFLYKVPLKFLAHFCLSSGFSSFYYYTL